MPYEDKATLQSIIDSMQTDLTKLRTKLEAVRTRIAALATWPEHHSAELHDAGLWAEAIVEWCEKAIAESSDYITEADYGNMKRYDVTSCEEYPRCNPIAECEDGDYCLYEDVSALKAELEAARAEIAIQAAMIEAMAVLLDEFETINCPHPKDYPCPLRAVPREKNCVECLKKYFREQAEKARTE